MKGDVQLPRLVLLIAAMVPAVAAIAVSEGDSATVHRIEVEAVPGLILHTNQFLRGNNPETRTMNHSFVTKVKYAFSPPEDSEQAAIYKGVYQGVGLAFHDFNPQLGSPVSAYIFQGATIKSLSRRLSLNYEWDFGLTCGWRPFDRDDNPDNRVIGSKVTAYIDAEVYLRWMISRHWDLNVGTTFTHYSNGNTAIPNAGLNVVGAKASVAYYLNRKKEGCRGGGSASSLSPDSPSDRWLWDLTLYGAWKRRGYDIGDESFVLPGTYGVAGFNLNPLYRLNHMLNVGPSLDAFYDGSTNLKLDGIVPLYGDYTPADDNHIAHPSWTRQVGLGLSARAEFVMPYFTINFGIGHNLVNLNTRDMDGFYEILALKIGLTRKAYLHIGYSLYEFRRPNNLMLGLGLHL